MHGLAQLPGGQEVEAGEGIDRSAGGTRRRHVFFRHLPQGDAVVAGHDVQFYRLEQEIAVPVVCQKAQRLGDRFMQLRRRGGGGASQHCGETLQPAVTRGEIPGNGVKPCLVTGGVVFEAVGDERRAQSGFAGQQ
ncbi:hypothetical protein FQZ97_1079930 [compost metagenome]